MGSKTKPSNGRRVSRATQEKQREPASPTPSDLANIATWASGLAEFLKEHRGRVGNHVLPFGDRFGFLRAHLGKLSAPKYRTLVWGGWPSEAPPLVADIAGAAKSIAATFFVTVAEHNAADGPSDKLARAKAKKADVRTLEVAGKKLLAIARQRMSTGVIVEVPKEYGSPRTPEAWVKLFPFSETTFNRKRESGHLRSIQEGHLIWIHRDDVTKYRKPE